MSFLMIPVSTLYDEYIERRKFTEQKKNPVEYIVPPPQEGRNNKIIIDVVPAHKWNLATLKFLVDCS